MVEGSRRRIVQATWAKDSLKRSQASDVGGCSLQWGNLMPLYGIPYSGTGKPYTGNPSVRFDEGKEAHHEPPPALFSQGSTARQKPFDTVVRSKGLACGKECMGCAACTTVLTRIHWIEGFTCSDGLRRNEYRGAQRQRNHDAELLQSAPTQSVGVRIGLLLESK